MHCSSASSPEGGFRVSLRSKGAVNVAKVAETFGGGGHTCASGCGIDGPLSVAAERMIAQLRMRGFDNNGHAERSHPDKVQ